MIFGFVFSVPSNAYLLCLHSLLRVATKNNDLLVTCLICM